MFDLSTRGKKIEGTRKKLRDVPRRRRWMTGKTEGTGKGTQVSDSQLESNVVVRLNLRTGDIEES